MINNTIYYSIVLNSFKYWIILNNNTLHVSYFAIFRHWTVIEKKTLRLSERINWKLIKLICQYIYLFYFILFFYIFYLFYLCRGKWRDKYINNLVEKLNIFPVRHRTLRVLIRGCFLMTRSSGVRRAVEMSVIFNTKTLNRMGEILSRIASHTSLRRPASHFQAIVTRPGAS